MSHEKDRDHRPAHAPREPQQLVSRTCPDRNRREPHPTPVPREPVDPKVHPGR